ncbi:MAG: glycosyltransferase [Planctomycetaceae bacterium]
MPIKRPPMSYLAEALRSLQRQTLENWELLLLDSSPVDSEMDWEMLSVDKRFDIRLPSDYSLTEQLNWGLEQARSAIIARADADDINEPWRLQEQFEGLSRRPDVAVLGTAIAMIDLNGRSLGVRSYPESCAAIRRAMRASTRWQHRQSCSAESRFAAGGTDSPDDRHRITNCGAAC